MSVCICTCVSIYVHTYANVLQFSQWLYVALPLILEHTYRDYPSLSNETDIQTNQLVTCKS